MKKLILSLMLILPLLAAAPIVNPVVATYGLNVFGPN